ERVSRKGAKAQRQSAKPSLLVRCFTSLCVFAPLREIAFSRTADAMIISIALLFHHAWAQTPTPINPTTQTQTTISRYLDQTDGMTADQAVAYALEHNGELQAARKEIDAARAMVKQARLRANPKVDIGVSQNVIGTDHNID